MSGGSYNYLYRWEDDAPVDDLGEMVARLESLGLHDAAARTASFMQPRLAPDDPIRDLWRAVEWNDSGDGATGDLDRGIAAYRASEKGAQESWSV